MIKIVVNRSSFISKPFCWLLLLWMASSCVPKHMLNTPADIPELAKQEFRARFPRVQSAAWASEPGLYIAQFNQYAKTSEPDPKADGYVNISFYRGGEMDGRWYKTLEHYLIEKHYEKKIPAATLDKMKRKIKALNQPAIGFISIVQCAEKYYGGIHAQAYLVYAYDPAREDSWSVRYFTFEGELIR